MATFAQFFGVVARQFEWRVASENAAPVVEKDGEGKLPLLDLRRDDVADLILNQLVGC